MAIKSIGIDIRAAHGNGAGKGTYCLEITKAILKVLPKNLEVRLYTDKLNPKIPESKQVLIKGRGILWHFNLKKYIKSHPVDFFIAPSSFIYPAIAPKSQKTAIVVHDMIAFMFAKNHKLFPTLVERLTLGRAIKNSEFIITVSKNTQKDLCRIKAAAKKREIVLAYPAVSEIFKAQKTAILELPEKYVLAVGTIEPRKNFESIFKAFEKLAHRHADLHLCIAGAKGWQVSKIFKNFPKHLSDRIHFLGYVPLHNLPELYSRAKCLIYPSLYEGFGIPPLEAMACGCPVVTSNVSSLPEVVGNAAITSGPTDIKAIVEGVEKIMKNPDSYIKKGLAQAKKFRWEESAAKILDELMSGD